MNIKLRWCEHRTRLRSGNHHAYKLQRAWNKYGESAAVFEIIALHEREQLLAMERAEISSIPRRRLLNSSIDPVNVWLTEETRNKFEVIHSSPAWRAERSKIAKEVGARRAVAVDCSNGERYESLHSAAAAFGIRPSGVAHLVKTQRVGRLGVKFKRADEDWREVLSASEQAKLTKRKNGGFTFSDETRRRMSESAKARRAREASNASA